MFFFFQAEDGIRDKLVTGVQTCALPICIRCAKSDSIYDYFHVGVLGYSADSCKPALDGELSGRSLVPISVLATKPLRIEEIGRASCRERVYISVVAVSLKKKRVKSVTQQ